MLTLVSVAQSQPHPSLHDDARGPRHQGSDHFWSGIGNHDRVLRYRNSSDRYAHAAFVPDSQRWSTRDWESSSPRRSTGWFAGSDDRHLATDRSLRGGHSDQAITSQVRRDLEASRHSTQDLRRIDIRTRNGTVTLRGPVNSNTEKMHAFRIAQRVAGAGQVVNQIQVRQNSRTDG